MTKYKKGVKKKPASLEKTPLDAPKQPGPAGHAGNIVGRAVLQELSSAVLYKLLQLKKIEGRSKIKRKGARLETLGGIVTVTDLEAVGVPVPADSRAEPPHVPPGGTRPSEGPRIRPGRGVRLDVPAGGIDIHEGNVWLAVADEGGIKAELTLRNDAGGIHDLINACRHHGVEHVAMESTGEYWLKAFWKLTEAGIHVLVANPLQTKATQGPKTDPEDARRIALAFRDGRLKPSVVCTPEQYGRRKLNRDAIKKTQQGSKAVNRMRVSYHIFDAAGWIRELHTSQRGQRILLQCLQLADADEIERVLTDEYGRGSHQVTDPVELRERAVELEAFLSELNRDAGNRLRFGHHLEEYISCQRRATELRLQVLKHADEDPQFKQDLALLVTHPSIGANTALTILVELVDVRYFWRAKSLVQWTGLAPRVRQSGHRKRQTGHITKAGNKWLRYACWLVAKAEYAQAEREGHPVGRFVWRLYKQGGKPYKVAVTAGARKVLTYIFHILGQRRPFEEIFAEEECERLAANRERKLKALARDIKYASAADYLPHVTRALERECLLFNEVTASYAEKITAILGEALRDAIT